MITGIPGNLPTRPRVGRFPYGFSFSVVYVISPKKFTNQPGQFFFVSSDSPWRSNETFWVSFCIRSSGCLCGAWTATIGRLDEVEGQWRASGGLVEGILLESMDDDNMVMK